MSNEAVLFLVLIILVLGALPAWPYSSSWGYAPSGGLVVVLIIILIIAMSQGKPLLGNTSSNLRSASSDAKDTMEDVGRDLQSAGRGVADSIRNAVQAQ